MEDRPDTDEIMITPEMIEAGLALLRLRFPQCSQLSPKLASAHAVTAPTTKKPR